jgi:hypothetical protein
MLKIVLTGVGIGLVLVTAFLSLMAGAVIAVYGMAPHG